MTGQAPFSPDTIALREALRGLRHVLRRGGHSFAETLSADTLPTPAAQVAARVMREAEGIARSLDVAASSLVKTVLGDGPADAVRLTDRATPDMSAPFARAFYVAVNSVLLRCGIDVAFVSEVAARESYAECRLRDHGDAAERAADLMVALLRRRVVRDLLPMGAPSRPTAAGPLVVFSVLLWQLSSWSDTESDAALQAAVDLAQAMADEVDCAATAEDLPRLAALFRKYAAHV